ncbi:MAG: hypothetical protein IJP88_10980, partial [Synergistaceae bacterium]|nr:hypothetical protein [Synergistaceae bacterium]
MQVDLMGAIQEAKRRAQETASGDSGLISADDLNRILNLARASAGELPSIGIGHEMTPEESSWIKPQRPSYIGTRMERTLPEASWLDYITSGTANLFTRGAEEAKMWQNEYEEAAKSAQGRAPTPAEQQEIEMNAPDLLNLPENERAAAWHKRLAKAQEFRGERDMRAANKIKPTEFRRPESGLQSIAAEVLQNVPYSLKNMPSNALATMTMGVPGAFLGGALSAFGEGRDEGTDVYWDLRAKGVPHKEAFDRAMRHTGWTTGGLMLSDPIENMATFGLGKLFPNMSPFARTIVGAGVNMAGEGAEEGLEEIGASLSKGEPIDWGNVGHASGIGAISGGIMGAAGNVLSNIANAYNNALKPDLNDVTSQVAEALYRENEVDRLENEYLDWYRDWGEPIEQRDAARADDYNEEDLAEANRQVEEFTAEQEQQRKAQEQAKREQEAADRELEAEDYLARLERDLTRQQQINQEYDLNALDDYYINEYENEAENLQRTNNNIVQNQRINQNQADINAQNRAYNANKQARQAQSEQQARENARLEQERENNANYNNSLAGITGQLTARNGEPNQLESIVQSLSLGQDRLNSGVNTFNELNNTINRLESAKGTDGDINRIIANIDRKLEQLRSETRSDTMRDNIRRDRAGRELQQELNARLEARDNRERQAERNNQAFNAQNEVNAQEREYNANKRDNQARQEARNHEIARLERERAALEDLQAISRERQAERNNQTFNAQNEVNVQNRDYNAVKQEQQARQTAQKRENARLERERAAIAELQAVERERKSDAAKNNRVFNAQNEVNEQNREYEQNKRRQQAKRYNQQREADRLENNRQNLAVQMAENELNKANKQAESDNADINSLLDAKESRLSQSEQKRETRETRKQERQEARNNQLTIDQSTSNAQKQEQNVTAAALESANKPTEKAALNEATREQDGASVETGKSADNLGRKNSIREVINAAKTGQGAKNSERIWVDYAEVTPEEAKKLSEATGLDIDDTYKHTFVGSGFIHSQKEHGITTEKHTAQLPVTEQDYEMIPEVIHNADNITRGNNKTATGRDTIVYTKHINGHVLIVEEVREKRGKLAFHTIRKSKPGYSYDTSKEGHPVVKEKADPREVRPERPQPEVKSPHAVNLDNTISQASESVKEPEVANKSVEKAALNEAKKKQEGGEEGESETVTEAENIKRGTEAMNKVISEQTDVMNAMYREDLGDISFIWGESGDAPYYMNGSGISHIIAKRKAEGMDSEKFLMDLVEVIATGQNEGEYTRRGGRPRVNIRKGNIVAVLGKVRNGEKVTWVVTGWDESVPPLKKTRSSDVLDKEQGFSNTTLSETTPPASEREQTAGSENIVKDNKQGVKQAETNPKNRDTIKTAAGLEDTVTYKIVDASEL